jgi:hypothetical protein
MPTLLGEIAYLDVEAIDDLLSALEQGLFVGSQKRSSTTKQGQRELSVLFQGIGAKAGDSRTTEDQREESFSATPAAKAARVNSLLDERGLVSAIFGSDAAAWNGIDEGEFLECRVRIEISPFHAFLNDADGFLRSIAQLAPFLGTQGEKVPALRAQVEALRSVFTAQRALPVMLYPADAEVSPRRFFAFLDTGAGVYRPRSFTGTGVALGRVRRVLRDSESIDLLQVGGLSLPRDKVRGMLAGFKGNPLGKDIRLNDLKVVAPAIELQILAIVR